MGQAEWEVSVSVARVCGRKGGGTDVVELLDDLGSEFRGAGLGDRGPGLDPGDDHLEPEGGDVAYTLVLAGGEGDEAVEDGLDAGRVDVPDERGEAASGGCIVSGALPPPSSAGGCGLAS